MSEAGVRRLREAFLDIADLSADLTAGGLPKAELVTAFASHLGALLALHFEPSGLPAAVAVCERMIAGAALGNAEPAGRC